MCSRIVNWWSCVIENQVKSIKTSLTSIPLSLFSRNSEYSTTTIYNYIAKNKTKKTKTKNKTKQKKNLKKLYSGKKNSLHVVPRTKSNFKSNACGKLRQTIYFFGLTWLSWISSWCCPRVTPIPSRGRGSSWCWGTICWLTWGWCTIWLLCSWGAIGLLTWWWCSIRGLQTWNRYWCN